MTQIPQNPTQQAAPAQGSDPLSPRNLTDAELRGLAYFAIGITSEGSDKGYKLIVAGDNPRTPAITPAENSGYTIGTLQTDLGQHYQPNVPQGENVPRDLINAYQEWANTNQPNWVLNETQKAETISDLGRNGNTIRAQGGREMDTTIKSHLDTFLASSDGISFVHNRDIGQVNKLMDNVLSPLQQTTLYLNSDLDDQARLATITAKLYNQNETYGGRVLGNIQNNTYQNIEDVSNAIDNLRPRIAAPRDYVESGRDHALEGTKVFNALRNIQTENPLHQTWQNIVADPLVNPTQLKPAPETLPNLPPRLPMPAADNQSQIAAPIWQPDWQPEARVGPPLRPMPYETNPNIAAEYTVTKNLFLQPTEGLKFIEALDRGGAYSYGRPRQEGNSLPTAGFYVMGNDFVQWNLDGAGQANIGGVWSDVSRNDLTRVKNADRTIDLNINQNGLVRQLLHVDPSAPALRPVVVSPENQAEPHAPVRAIQDPRQRLPERDAQDPRNPQHPVQPGQQERPGQAPQMGPRREGGGQAALGADDLNPQDKDQHEKIRIAVQKLGFEGEPANNMVAALLLKTKVEGGIKNVDEVKLNEATATNPEGRFAIATSKPYGEGRIPYFHAAVNVAEALQIPAEKSFQDIASFNQQQSQQQVLAQQQTQAQQQNKEQNQSPVQQITGGVTMKGPTQA